MTWSIFLDFSLMTRMVELLGNRLDKMYVDDAEYIILLAWECTPPLILCCTTPNHPRD